MDLFERYPRRPIITPEQIKADGRFDVIGSFNPAATVFNGQIHLLIRVALKPKDQPEDEVWAAYFDPKINDYRFIKREKTAVDAADPRFFIEDGHMYLTSISEFYLARLDDDFNVVGDIKLAMRATDQSEAYGIEDPRITRIDDMYYILYTAVSQHGQAVRLAKTSDFKSYERLGIVLPPNNKDCVLFPRKINGRYYMVHRPSAAGVPKPEMWIASSRDLKSWGEHKLLMSPKEEWESGRIGAGAPPIETKDGWLLSYHGANDKHYYHMGFVLLDLEEPWKIKWRSKEPSFSPMVDYEKKGFFGDVVFGTGIVELKDELFMFYGASDTTTAVAKTTVDQVLEACTTKEGI